MLDEKSELMCIALIGTSGLTYSEWLDRVKDRLTKDEFIPRMKKLTSSGVVKKRKRKFFLKITKDIENFYKSINKDLKKMEKKIESVINGKKPFENSFQLMRKLLDNTAFLHFIKPYAKLLEVYDSKLIEKNIMKVDGLIKKMLYSLGKKNLNAFVDFSVLMQKKLTEKL